ncbi:MAG: dGTP triphosphohydrolase, partial [Planctomycetota bacterium]
MGHSRHIAILTRHDLEQREESLLGPYAVFSGRTKGRVHDEAPHPYRTEFQRDRDRVIHSSAFRRLEYKTQVFVNHEGDYYRTRLTHTLETAQIARTLARSLRLNEDLVETAALAHDLGHTPFGHAGQDVMDELMKPHGGFEHNLQSLRIVELLETRYPQFPGLNLCEESREAIAKHSPKDVMGLPPGWPSLEGQLVDTVDSIAYLSADLDDGLRSGILTPEQISSLDLVSQALERVRQKSPHLDFREHRRPLISEIINILT